ncbi:hypothetical protein AB0D49_01245 [Streptomyces sp. NPDC048290]|uniref:hypothetical protein n=1 Tax=Streptomyces sp. NPDC048290 TaxID=3155811 RepID=UPI003447B5F9
MSNRQRNRRVIRLRKSPGFPPSRRRPKTDPADGAIPGAATTEATDTPNTASNDQT